MLSRLLLLFTLLPVIEIAILVWIATETSVVFVLGLVIGTGVLGAGLARYQGWQTFRRISADLDMGRMRMVAMNHGRAGTSFDGDEIIDVRVVQSPPGQLPR
ncbi:MAG: FxsA family protein [Planctomycetia bacterium]|nr:FxsA family protein [Planctomycetia bacterium]